MEEGKFQILLNILRAIASSGPEMETAIAGVFDAFNDAFTEEQKKEATHEFERYEERRTELNRLKAVLEEEKYREIVRRDPAKEENEGGAY